MTNSNKLGIIGEKEAVKYLNNNGYQILETNWRYLHKELDIIAKIEDMICIIEVKTRKSNYIRPSEAVNHKKQRNLILAANEYVKQNDLEYDVRFDIIEIISNSKQLSINHIIDAFYPSLQ
jgi:putative endonuclease